MSEMGQRFGGSSFLEVALDRFFSPELLDFVHQWNIDLDEVKSLKRTALKIQTLSDDAEMKQFTSDAVKLWLGDLKHLLYDAEDILDEFATELLRLKIESQTQIGAESAVVDISEDFGSIVRDINENFRSKVRDIKERLEREAQEGVGLGLNSSSGSRSSKHRVFSGRETSSLVKKSEVFVRENDKWEIVKRLISDKKPASSCSNLSVLSIVGMGGAGKTTLAQRAYNDDRVERHFELKAWVCVSEDFDVLRLTREILESATKSSAPSSNSLDVLQGRLEETLRNKRFLLVLDDMWNEDEQRWDALCTSFESGKSGSKILVTTRNKSVSSIVSTVVDDDHELKGLSDEYCLSMFRSHAFKDENSSDSKWKMELFGQEIVNKCKGLPLAIKTLAGLLRAKKENNEWEDILKDEIWELKQDKILPSLMLSYHHLPPLVKRCFAYCALFPKDYLFNKIDLVLLWMAEGFVQPKPSGKKRLEDIGAGYFDELFMRSFFELSDSHHPIRDEPPFSGPNPGYTPQCNSFLSWSTSLQTKSFFESSNNIGSRFVMHDLIHDLAEFILGKTYFRREEYDKSSRVFTPTHHFSHFTDRFEFEVKRKSLRTFLVFFSSLNNTGLPAKQFQFLRVLRFRGCNEEKLPDSIGKLKHLRLLDLSYSKIVTLPNSITSLHNLQTLVLTGCHNLVEFPKDIGNFVNLRHLLLPNYLRAGYFYKTLVVGVGKLSNLQTLSSFTVGSTNINGLGDLSQQLRGTLEISYLGNVVCHDNTGAMVGGNFKNNTRLLGLQLQWSAYERDDSFPDLGRDEKADEDLLNQLQPPTNLETLWIEHYGGTKFPSWMENPHSLSHLETLHLIDCQKCRFLPNLRQLPLLKHLYIYNCNAIKMVGSKLCGDGSSSSASKQFRSLETLSIKCMDEWEEWPVVVGEDDEEDGGGQFPRLRQLTIKLCPKLRKFSHRFPALVRLQIQDCPSLRELPRILPSLESLYVSDCEEFCFLPTSPSVKHLTLVRCKGMEFKNKTGSHFSSLTSLIINDVSDLRLLPNEFTRHMPTLKELSIFFCRELTVLLQNESGSDLLPSSLRCLTIFSCDKLWKLPQSMYALTSLQELEIAYCSALVSFPETGLPTALQKLWIRNCKNLKSLPMGLHKLTSLQILEIKECPALEFFPHMRLPTTIRSYRF